MASLRTLSFLLAPTPSRLPLWGSMSTPFGLLRLAMRYCISSVYPCFLFCRLGDYSIALFVTKSGGSANICSFWFEPIPKACFLSVLKASLNFWGFVNFYPDFIGVYSVWDYCFTGLLNRFWINYSGAGPSELTFLECIYFLGETASSFFLLLCVGKLAVTYSLEFFLLGLS